MIGLCILHIINEREIFTNKACFGIYRDDFVGVIHVPIQNIEHNVKKEVRDTFKEFELDLEEFVIGKKCSYLDVEFDLRMDSIDIFEIPVILSNACIEKVTTRTTS